MRDVDLGQVLRVLRRRLGLRQVDVAERARLSRATVSLLERGRFDLFTLDTIRSAGSAYGVKIDLCAPWLGGELDRLRDQDHATLQDIWVRLLESAGWRVRVEAGYNHYGERGRIDVLAYHAASRVLLIVEVKAALHDLQATLGQLDAHVRRAGGIARGLAWAPATVVPCLVLADGTTQRRRVQEYAALLARFAMRGREAKAWLRSPAASTAPTGLLLMTSLPPANRVSANRRRVQRIRAKTAVSRSTSASPRPPVRGLVR